ncbi:MAG: DUF29 domain-containing protein [Shackletoniella antarctica]|uniref:DUF29 domain-containing protein n=1 Tax=Shackletoniella antarctica TaxID=268115 RepID=A0A2W4W558_9CYAN|nr:MAG: DUF29 domain-containing protein [Shackletoniella antarctica]
MALGDKSLATTTAQPLYEADFYGWTQQQAHLLQSQRWAELDIANLVEEIESLGKQQRQELRNRLGVLLGHLLKWQFQPDRRSKSWVATLREQRREILMLLEESPSLKPYLPEAIAVGYQAGLDLVVRETPLAYSDLPETSGYTTEQVLSADYLPKAV